MSVCEMQERFAQVDFQWQQAQYNRLEAEARLRQAQHAADVTFPTPPKMRNPFGLGAIYCGILGRLFGVQTAQAAEAPPQGGSSGAAPPSPASAPGAGQQPQAGGAAGQAQQVTEARLNVDIQNAVIRENVARYQRIRYDIEIQKKFSLAAACIIFVLLGPPIALRFPRGGVGLVIGVSFGVFALYYVGLIGGEALANAEFISPFWAMWSANLVMLVAGIVLTLRMNHQSAATRGGDWGELRGSVANALRRVTGRPRRGAA
jgi:lipopolysaccharide export system permease protein